MAPVASIVRKQAPNWHVATIRTSTVGLRRVASHGTISTNASAQTTATSTIKDEANPVVIECAVEHDLKRAEKGRDQRRRAESGAASLEIGEDAIPSLGVQCVETLFEIALVIYAGPLPVAVTRAAGERWLPDPGRGW
jgi:hypothetical protein